MHFEKGEYDQVIEVCSKGLDVGREQRADYKHVAKWVASTLWIKSSTFPLSNLPDLLPTISKISIHRPPPFRSLSRIGKAYFKKKDLDNAMVFYDKAICEHRDPAILKERSEVSVIESSGLSWREK